MLLLFKLLVGFVGVSMGAVIVYYATLRFLEGVTLHEELEEFD